RAPQKIARPESVQKNDGGSSVPISLDVHRSGTHGSSQDISLHLYTPLLAFASQRTQPSTHEIDHGRCLETTNHPETPTYPQKRSSGSPVHQVGQNRFSGCSVSSRSLALRRWDTSRASP